MRKSKGFLNSSMTKCTSLILLWVFLGSALFRPTLANPSASGDLYLKSRLGLMPPAYGPTAEELLTLRREALVNSSRFDPFVVYSLGSWPEAVAAARYSGDGRTDAVLSTSFVWDPANDNQVHLFAQTPGGTLTRTARLAAESNPMAITNGDLNRDGRIDVAVANQSAGTVGVLLQQPAGGLAAMVAYSAGAGPDGVAVGDFNGDLRADLAVSHAIDQQVGIYYQRADGTLAAPVLLGVSSAGYNELATGDIDGDGYDDLVLLRGAGHAAFQVAVFYQRNRQLTAPIFRTAQDGGFLAHGLAVGDVTGDGRDDIVVTAGGNAPQAYLNVFPQLADGTLAITPTVYAAYHLPQAVEIGDVNHDGRNDVVVNHAAWLALSVYTQTEAGTLSPYERYALPYSDFYRPTSLALADVTNDGALDVLAASHSSLPAENGLVVLSNTGAAPTSTITIPALGTFITDTAVYQAQGLASTANGMLALSFDGGRTWVTQTPTLNWTHNWTVPLTDGAYIILARVTDTAGQVQSPPARTRAIVDRTLPVGSVLVNNGAIYTNQPTVSLGVTGSDFNDVDRMRFANQGGGYSSWVPFTATYALWPLAGPDGAKTVTGQVRDVPGNASLPFSDTIILDTTPPACQVLVDGDALYTNSPAVTLTLAAADTNGVATMRVRNAGGGWTDWQPYTATMNWNIGGSDGSHNVEAQFRDVAGNDSPVCNDTIVLDTAAPSCGIAIAGGAPYTMLPAVTLNLTSSDLNGVAQMRARDLGQGWTAWEPYAPARAWVLPAPDGAKTVEAQFRDVAGNDSAVCGDSIILDTTPPVGFVLIDGGALYAAIPMVTLTLGASDLNGVTDMRCRNDGGGWAPWQPYGLNASWVLTPGDGAKTVSCQFRDTPGNVGGPFTDTIILDTTPPGGALVIDAGATYTRFPTVTLTITATDQIPVTQMRFSNDGAGWTPWESYAGTRSWVLVPGDGVKTVYVEFRDAVGNVSAPLADAIVLDMTAPTCPVLLINSGAPYVTQTAVVLNVSCVDANPPIQVRYSNDGSSWTPWEPYSAVKDWTLVGGDGLKTVYVAAQDAPGNFGGPFTATITLDTTPPACTIAINEDAPYVTETSVVLDIACADINGIDRIRLSDDGVNWGSWRALAPTLPWTLPWGDGVKAVYLQARDGPGNVAAPASDAIILDTTRPTGGCAIPDDNGYVNNPNVVVAPWAYDDNGVPWMQLRDAGVPWPGWITYTTAFPWVLPGGDGEKVIECEFQDTPGNVSPAYSCSIVLDEQQPTCDLQVQGGDDYVNQLLVTLALSSTDNYGVEGMRFRNDPGDWIFWEPFAASRSWTLLAGDGPQTVYGQFRDLANNVQQCSDDIILDTTPPTGTITLAEGADYAATPTVTVTLAATDTLSGVGQVCIAAAGAPCTYWQAYTTTLTWTLALTDGMPQEVCAFFADRATNESGPACDAILLDRVPPGGSIVVAEGSSFVSATLVPVALVADDATSGVADMRLYNCGNTGSWQPFTPNVSWNLLSGDGEKAVCVEYRDAAGLVSLAYSDTVTLDTVPPTGSVVINGGASHTGPVTVTLTLEAQDLTSGVCGLQVRNSGVPWAEWIVYTTTLRWTLDREWGPHTVEVRFRDCAGNTGPAGTDSIILGYSLYLPAVMKNTTTP